MKKLTIYLCSVCGVHHESEEDALNCEESHNLAEVIDRQYMFTGRGSYPARLEVSMSDGRIAVYELSYWK